MSPFPKSIKELCLPSSVYFLISMVGLFLIFLQNLGNTNSYQIGTFSCVVPNTFIVFVFKFVYILFWTYILNLICKDGHKELSWLLVLLPIVLMFVILGVIMLN
jgi:hypothetical protein